MSSNGRVIVVSWNDRFKAVGFTVVSAAIAQWGGASLEFLLRAIARWAFPHAALRTLVLRDCGFALLAGAVVSLSVQRYWRTKSAQWTWVVFAVWFAYGAVSYALLLSQSVMSTREFWPHLLGYNCALRGGPAACYDFFIFTVPLLRGVAYSITASFGLRFSADRSTSRLSHGTL